MKKKKQTNEYASDCVIMTYNNWCADYLDFVIDIVVFSSKNSFRFFETFSIIKGN